MKAKRIRYNNDHIPVTRLTGLLGPPHSGNTKSALRSRILFSKSLPLLEQVPFEYFFRKSRR